VVLDPQTKLAIDVFPCEDAHAQERTLIPAVLETVRQGDLWIADRNFCTMGFLAGLRECCAHFIIREHGGSTRSQLVGRRRKIGRCDTGMVYEQALQLLDEAGTVTATLRRVTVVLDQPTRDGDKEIHVLTNLPKRIGARDVADLYRKRWTIETAFQELAENLSGEIETLGYPRAALFAFCMALVAFNLLSVVLTTLRSAQPANDEHELSLYYVCDEVAHTYRGLDLVLDPEDWTRAFASLTTTQLARKLKQIAANVNLARYHKHPRGPKKPPPRMVKTHRNHVSTARILAAAK
jgi:hypothetical protein